MKKLIESILVKRNLSKNQLAEKLNITPQHLQKIFRNGYITSVKMLKELSDILDVPTDLFLQQFDEKTFLIYAISDYIKKIQREDAKQVLYLTMTLLENEEDIL